MDVTVEYVNGANSIQVGDRLGGDPVLMNVVFLVCHVDHASVGVGGMAQRLLETGNNTDIVYVTEDYTYHSKKNYDNRQEPRQAWGVFGLNEVRIHYLHFPMMKLNTESLIDVNMSFEKAGLNPM
ncbi:hypothetical protein EXE48_07615 [Halorubrum sp. ASP1]|uniref:hypothetical protein n=1 Tax=Halorubrum sp. ASP1 TaxID=2518114 RepID=UPI0010F7EC32|nr:hypothetical protein [Halorubrum sp. ASP1]TKX61659.1 hypothetical protein EXE48_07615 [Halorubrum sp. ASP1]